MDVWWCMHLRKTWAKHITLGVQIVPGMEARAGPSVKTAGNHAAVGGWGEIWTILMAWVMGRAMGDALWCPGVLMQCVNLCELLQFWMVHLHQDVTVLISLAQDACVSSIFQAHHGVSYVRSWKLSTKFCCYFKLRWRDSQKSWNVRSPGLSWPSFTNSGAARRTLSPRVSKRRWVCAAGDMKTRRAFGPSLKSITPYWAFTQEVFVAYLY